jgi:NADH-quinone oxidoreductase subunit D
VSEPVGGEELELAFGPRHPALQGVLRLRLTLAGETIVACRPRIGYGHRGLEKLCEAVSLRDGVALTDRLDFVAAAAANLAYCGAVERLLGLAVPRRARFLRVVLAELQRVASHLLWLGTHAADAGIEDALLPCLRDRDRVLDLLESYCGARLTLSCAVPGGLPREPPPAWLDRCAELAAALPAMVDRHQERLAAAGRFNRRTVGLGVLAPETALDFGVTGPVLRGSGVDWDVRRALPYDAYGELDFEVPVGRNGDAWDRCQVRVAELRQAALLVTRCLDRLPPGPIRLAMADAAACGPQAESYFSVEGPRGEVGFYLTLDERRGAPPPPTVAAASTAAGASPEASAVLESPAGAGLDLGALRPWRCHVRAPSFYNLQVLPELARGHTLAELVVLLGSLDLALGEVDR